MNKRFECRSCNDRQCAAECEDTPKTCMLALREPMPLWFPVGGSSVAEAMEDKQDKVPEWCQVGAWVFEVTRKKFHRIKAFDSFDGWSAAKWDDRGDGYIGSCTIEHLKPAHLRPWTGSEAIGKIVRWPSATRGFCHGAITYTDPRGLCDCGAAQKIPLGQLIDPERYLQLDGSPCGVLEIAEGN